MNAVPLQAQSHKKSGNLIHGMKDAVNPRFHCSVMVRNMNYVYSLTHFGRHFNAEALKRKTFVNFLRFL